MTVDRQDFAGERPEAPFHAVADDGLADFLADREADAHLLVAVGAIAYEEHESRSRGSPSGIGREEIRAFLDYREGF